MSIVTVKNHREHDIDLHMGGERVVVPAGTFPDKGKAMVPGMVNIDAEQLDKLKKSNQAVHGMFEEGWLSTSVKKPVVAKESDNDEDGKDGKDGKGGKDKK